MVGLLDENDYLILALDAVLDTDAGNVALQENEMVAVVVRLGSEFACDHHST